MTEGKRSPNLFLPMLIVTASIRLGCGSICLQVKPGACCTVCVEGTSGLVASGGCLLFQPARKLRRRVYGLVYSRKGMVTPTGIILHQWWARVVIGMFSESGYTGVLRFLPTSSLPGGPACHSTIQRDADLRIFNSGFLILMLLDVRGRTRATLRESACLSLPKKAG